MIGFIVHNIGDFVGVAVRDLVRDEDVEGWCMENDDTLRVKVTENIPLGHKIALRPTEIGRQVIKYGVSIGLATNAIGVGDHVHVHNLRSSRWRT